MGGFQNFKPKIFGEIYHLEVPPKDSTVHLTFFSLMNPKCKLSFLFLFLGISTRHFKSGYDFFRLISTLYQRNVIIDCWVEFHAGPGHKT